ncbi:hypothetical protein GCM10010372_05760 [Streptomyces tauricus]|nr:hypothetical protein GCM10010372_05760 [Streptomyces tauricus]
MGQAIALMFIRERVLELVGVDSSRARFWLPQSVVSASRPRRRTADGERLVPPVHFPGTGDRPCTRRTHCHRDKLWRANTGASGGEYDGYEWVDRQTPTQG